MKYDIEKIKQGLLNYHIHAKEHDIFSLEPHSNMLDLHWNDDEYNQGFVISSRTWVLHICHQNGKIWPPLHWEKNYNGPGYDVKLHPAVTLNMSVGMWGCPLSQLPPHLQGNEAATTWVAELGSKRLGVLAIVVWWTILSL